MALASSVIIEFVKAGIGDMSIVVMNKRSRPHVGMPMHAALYFIGISRMGHFKEFYAPRHRRISD